MCILLCAPPFNESGYGPEWVAVVFSSLQLWTRLDLHQASYKSTTVCIGPWIVDAKPESTHTHMLSISMIFELNTWQIFGFLVKTDFNVFVYQSSRHPICERPKVVRVSVHPSFEWLDPLTLCQATSTSLSCLPVSSTTIHQSHNLSRYMCTSL